MNPSIPLAQRAERLVIRRAWTALLLGALFLFTQLLSLGEPPLGRSEVLHLAAWLAWCALLGVFMLWGSGLLGARGLGALLNDEGAVAHRQRAQQLGFWGALLAACAAYAASFYEPLSARDACRLIVTATLTPALLAFGWLELRSLRDS